MPDRLPRVAVFLGVMLPLIPVFARPLAAQDPFELEVYSPATAGAGEWKLEARTNYVVDGSTVAEGPVAATTHQARFTFELTHGISRQFEVSAYALAASRPGTGTEVAGWRLQARTRAPAEWHLPVDLGVGVEVGRTGAAYSDHPYAMEISPIVGRRWGPLAVAVNARLEHGLGGTGDADWELEPAASVQLRVNPSFALVTEYFGNVGALDAPAPAAAQAHVLFPGFALRLGDDMEWNAGVGIGLTRVSDALTLKTALEIPLRD